ncbi:basic proline-rich protein-like [Symphalangus syndactylus]|uniref:basic proline-rich protein-like n=1 Tax=Symphalangus syndactylus TaxID=9590 RepID=UPI003007E63B
MKPRDRAESRARARRRPDAGSGSGPRFPARLPRQLTWLPRALRPRSPGRPAPHSAPHSAPAGPALPPQLARPPRPLPPSARAFLPFPRVGPRATAACGARDPSPPEDGRLHLRTRLPCCLRRSVPLQLPKPPARATEGSRNAPGPFFWPTAVTPSDPPVPPCGGAAVWRLQPPSLVPGGEGRAAFLSPRRKGSQLQSRQPSGLHPLRCDAQTNWGGEKGRKTRFGNTTLSLELHITSPHLILTRPVGRVVILGLEMRKPRLGEMKHCAATERLLCNEAKANIFS